MSPVQEKQVRATRAHPNGDSSVRTTPGSEYVAGRRVLEKLSCLSFAPPPEKMTA